MMKNLSGKLLGHIFVLLFAALSFQATAAPQAPGSDFNHSTTGFALTGGHLAAACETCHIGGVFKGTPRNCDGCHAVGKRVVATPKSSSHIVTDAPCDTCHFNANTWLGARYNHGTAQPGSCQTCHNGRLSMTKPPSHNTGNKATNSCDQCHRTYAWLPATWNHTGVGFCSSCHVSSPEVSVANRKPASHVPTALKGTLECDSCHNYIAWYPNRFKHNTGAPCSSCHNSTLAVGKPGGHPSTTDECNQCHTSTNAWLPALGAKPANHIPYNTGVQCSSCHVGGGVVSGGTLHVPHLSTYACTTCHLSGTSYLGNMDKKSKSHESWSDPISQGGKGGAGDCSQSGCHKPAGSRGSSYVTWD